MVEALSNKKTDEVTAAIARMVAKLKYLGLEPRRVHSDRAREMSNRVANEMVYGSRNHSKLRGRLQGQWESGSRDRDDP